MALTPEEFNAHFQTEVTADIMRFADSLFPGYIFTERRGRRQNGYCTHCGSEWITDGLRQGEESRCPNCDMLCTVKASGRTRKYLVDEAYFVWYSKSLTDPQAVVARGIHAVRDYHGEYRGITTGLMDCAMYLFRPGKGGCEFYTRYCWYSGINFGCGSYSPHYSFQCGSYHKASTVYSLWAKKNMLTAYSRVSLQLAVHGTRFGRSGWEQYDYEDMVRFMAAAARYPCVEYLTKLGYSALVEDKIGGYHTYGAVNWNGRTAPAVLRISQKDVNDIRRLGIKPSFELLHIMQVSRKDGSNFTAAEAEDLVDKRGFLIYEKEMLEHSEYGNLRKITKYLLKQSAKDAAPYSYSGLWSHWRDYVRDAKLLEYDLADESVLWPRDLQTAHQHTIDQVRYKEDKELAAMIRARAKKLAELAFEQGGLIIRPAKTNTELINEGKALRHCVGGYAKSYAKGTTAIFVIRRAEDPKTPYYTAEVRNGDVIQCRGLRNCPPDETVRAFINTFKAEKLDKKTKRKEKVA